jgi:hypothetical protein
MANGDLKTYLRSHRPDVCEDPSKQPPTLKVLCCSLQFCMNWNRSWILIYSSWGPCSSWFLFFCLSHVFSQDKFGNKTNKEMYSENSVPHLPGLHTFWAPGHHGKYSFLAFLCPFVSVPLTLSSFFIPLYTSHWNIYLVLFLSYLYFLLSSVLYPFPVH